MNKRWRTFSERLTLVITFILSVIYVGGAFKSGFKSISDNVFLFGLEKAYPIPHTVFWWTDILFGLMTPVAVFVLWHIYKILDTPTDETTSTKDYAFIILCSILVGYGVGLGRGLVSGLVNMVLLPIIVAIFCLVGTVIYKIAAKFVGWVTASKVQ